MIRAVSFPQKYGGSFCLVDTSAIGTTRIDRATFRTHNELVIEFRLDDFSHVVSLLRKSDTFFRGTYTIQNKAGDSNHGEVSCHIFEMPEGPFAFGIWVEGAYRCNWWAYFEPMSQASEEQFGKVVLLHPTKCLAPTKPQSIQSPIPTKQAAVNPAASSDLPNPLPEFKARLKATIDVTWASGKEGRLLEGRIGSVSVMHGVLIFEPDGGASETQNFPVTPSEIEVLGFVGGNKTSFTPAMGNELDAPKFTAISKATKTKTQKATAPSAVEARVLPPIPEFRARLTVAIPIALSNGKEATMPKGKEGSLGYLHGRLRFEPDGTEAERQMFQVEPNEIDILGFKGQKSDFNPAMGNELDKPQFDAAKEAAKPGPTGTASEDQPRHASVIAEQLTASEANAPKALPAPETPRTTSVATVAPLATTSVEPNSIHSNLLVELTALQVDQVSVAVNALYAQFESNPRLHRAVAAGFNADRYLIEQGVIQVTAGWRNSRISSEYCELGSLGRLKLGEPPPASLIGRIPAKVRLKWRAPHWMLEIWFDKEKESYFKQRLDPEGARKRRKELIAKVRENSAKHAELRARVHNAAGRKSGSHILRSKSRIVSGGLPSLGKRR